MKYTSLMKVMSTIEPTICIVYKHWPAVRQFITRTVELWNRWIRLSCYCHRV